METYYLSLNMLREQKRQKERERELAYQLKGGSAHAWDWGDFWNRVEEHKQDPVTQVRWLYLRKPKKEGEDNLGGLFLMCRELVEVVAQFYLTGPMPICRSVPIPLYRWGVIFGEWEHFDAHVMINAQRAKGSYRDYYSPAYRFGEAFGHLYYPVTPRGLKDKGPSNWCVQLEEMIEEEMRECHEWAREDCREEAICVFEHTMELVAEFRYRLLRFVDTVWKNYVLEVKRAQALFPPKGKLLEAPKVPKELGWGEVPEETGVCNPWGGECVAIP